MLILAFLAATALPQHWYPVGKPGDKVTAPTGVTMQTAKGQAKVLMTAQPQGVTVNGFYIPVPPEFPEARKRRAPNPHQPQGRNDPRLLVHPKGGQ